MHFDNNGDGRYSYINIANRIGFQPVTDTEGCVQTGSCFYFNALKLHLDIFENKTGISEDMTHTFPNRTEKQ